MNNKKALFSLVAVLSLSGCVSAPIPPDYSGPLARIRDSAVPETSNRAQFFYVSELDGKKIENALMATRKANQGRGFSLMTVTHVRDVPAKLSTVLLEGRVAYGAPIQEILNMGTVYTVQKTIQFAPQSNKTYVVKGMLSEQQKDVWIEEEGTGKRLD